MKQRIVSFILAAAIMCSLLVGLAPGASALHLWIKDRSAVSGSDYTDSDKMAQKLDEIFDGSLSVYSNSGCTKPVSAPIGSSVMKNNGVAMYVGPYGGTAVNSGTSCWIYAQGVYYTLFKDYVLNNKSKTGNSENIDMSTTATKNCTYENFKAWGVRQGVGAMLRSAGHSMILLGYDEEKMITLEGNADSAGLVCIRERSWDILKNKYTSFAFIVQPKDSYMQEHYDACRHEHMSGLGVCPDCDYAYNWKRTLDSSAAGYYSANATCTPKTAPYTAAENGSAILGTGDLAQVQGSVTNYFGQVWYELLLDGTTVYAPAELLEFVSALPLQVTCSGFKPADGQALKAASYPLGGTVTSNYPLKRIDAYLDDVWYAAWTASNKNITQMTLGSTDINNDLTFGKLAQGKHVIKLVATDYAHTEPVTFHTSAFYIVGNNECLHSYSSSVTTAATCTAAGVMTYTCSTCGSTYTEEISALGHSYSCGYCTACYMLDFDYKFETAYLQVQAVEAVPGQTVSVPVTIENNQCFAKFTFIVSYDTANMTLTGATAGALLQNGSFSRSGSTVNWSGSSNIIGDGTLFYLNFQIHEAAPQGDYTVKVALKSNSTYYFRDENNNARDLELSPGGIKCVWKQPVSVYRQGVEQGDFSTLEQALETYDSTTDYIKLNEDLTAAVTLKQDLYIDLNGFNLKGTVHTAGYKVYGMDSATDGYTCETMGYFACTDENGKALVPEKHLKTDPAMTGNALRYMALETENGFTFHRFYLGITHQTLKPTVTGVGYKAAFYGDEMVAAALESFGYTLKLGNYTPKTVTADAESFVSGKTVTLRIDHFDAQAYGETELKALAVMKLADGTVIESAFCSMTFRGLVEYLNDHYASLTSDQLSAVKAMIENDTTIRSWKVENLI